MAEDLVSRARAGDAGSRTRLADRHYGAVHALARKLLQDPEAARDVTQETFLRAFARMDQYSGERPFSSWLLKIATNLVRDLHRRKGRWETAEEDPADEEAERPEAILQKGEEIGRVQAALDALAPEVRAPLVLHLQEGMPVREIAWVLDLTENAVRMKIYRGLRKVRATLGGIS